MDTDPTPTESTSTTTTSSNPWGPEYGSLLLRFSLGFGLFLAFFIFITIYNRIKFRKLAAANASISGSSNNTYSDNHQNQGDSAIEYENARRFEVAQESEAAIPSYELAVELPLAVVEKKYAPWLQDSSKEELELGELPPTYDEYISTQNVETVNENKVSESKNAPPNPATSNTNAEDVRKEECSSHANITSN